MAEVSIGRKGRALFAGVRLNWWTEKLTRPAMVAEFWQGRQHSNIQNLVIGVPSRTPGADRASHFDYVDDDVAPVRRRGRVIDEDVV